VNVLDKKAYEPIKFAVSSSIDASIGIWIVYRLAELGENIQYIYKSLYIEDKQIQVLQLRYKDYVIPPHYVFKFKINRL